MRASQSLPDINRLSIISAVIMLAFALTQVASFPAQMISFSIFGIVLEFLLDFGTVITLFTAVLAAVGVDWLIQSHPEKERQHAILENSRHWLIPIFTTLVIGVVLNSFAGGPYWWVIYGLGSLILIAVFIAEYNVVSLDESNPPLATIGLTGLSFVLFFLLAISVFSANLRLYIRLPLLALGAMLAISRSLHLRTGQWYPVWALVNSLVVSEIVVGFHYLPLSPLQFGLMLVGMAYSLTSIVTGIKETRKRWALWGEPLVMLFFTILIGIIWR